MIGQSAPEKIRNSLLQILAGQRRCKRAARSSMAKTRTGDQRLASCICAARRHARVSIPLKESSSARQ